MHILYLLIFGLLGIKAAESKLSSDKISVPVSDIEEEDTYMCYVTPVTALKAINIVGYEIDSLKHVAHHVSIAICQDFNSTDTIWDCRAQQGYITVGRAFSLGGKNGVDVEHSHMSFGEDIGLEVGGDTDLNYILIQVHYKDPVKAEDLIEPAVNITLYTTDEQQPYAQQFLMLASIGFIPAQTLFSSEIATKWEGGTVTIVSYTVHTHDYGVFEEGFLIRDGHAILIGRKESTPHENAVYDLEFPLELRNGDVIAARCVFDNYETYDVQFGLINKDEMCNFGIYFKYPSEDKSYPRGSTVLQNAQNSTWCADVVPGTRILCANTHDTLEEHLNM